MVEAEARIPHNLIGKRIIDSIPLGSKLSTLLAHLTVDEITAPDGHKVILSIIEDAHAYLKDHRLEQAFDEAIFRGRRERGQSMTAFLASKKASFAELRKQGLDLLSNAAGRHLLGHLILRQGGFSNDQRQRLKVVTNGSLDYKEIEMAIQKVFGDRLDEQSSFDGGPTRRWRSATYWDEGYGDDWNDDGEVETYAEMEMADDDPDLFEDLVCLNEENEVQMTFPEELPMIMDESVALETLGNNLENIFYETRERLKGKGKGKSKKGKGKGFAKTFGQAAYPGFGGGRGGYLEHRRMLQASRNARGYDRPSWQSRAGTRMSLHELKAKSRCHQCKQVGHWSKECPQRGRPSSGPRSTVSAGGTSNSSMSTGFFVEPPRSMASFSGEQFFSGAAKYVERPFSGLSFVFLGVNKSTGTALVGTAAQHGLVGLETLEAHDQFLHEHFGLRVQWSHEAGGSVRGVCGAEETTRIAYVPIGLGGKSGVLRVQVVPGDIPFLLPAYFLTELEAVIDMKHGTIMYMALGVKQDMNRLSTGHVSVSIVEFGDGFHVPATFCGTRSKAWSTKAVPDWSQLSTSHAPGSVAMGPVAALVAAVLYLHFPSRLADLHGSCSYPTTTGSSEIADEARTTGEADLRFAAAGAEDGGNCSGYKLNVNDWPVEHCPTGRTTATAGMHHGQRQIPGASIGSFTAVSTLKDHTWRQPHDELPEMLGLPARATDASDPFERPAALEPQPGLTADRLPQADGQLGAGEEEAGSHRVFGSTAQRLSQGSTKVCSQGNSCQEPSATSANLDRTERRGGRDLPEQCSLHRGRGGHGDGAVHQSTTASTLQSMSTRPGESHAGHSQSTVGMELQQSSMCVLLPGCERHPGTSTGCLPVSTMSSGGAVADQCGRSAGRDPASVLQLRASDLHVRDGSGVFQTGQIPGGEARLGYWMKDGNPHLETDENLGLNKSYDQIIEALDVDPLTTYVAIGYGDFVKGLTSVVTMPVISRRIILTKNGDGFWCAVNVSNIPGDDYQFGSTVHYMVFYEFTPEFVSYMVDVEFENETTLSRTTKTELSNSLDNVLGDLSVYWTLWENSDEPHDVVEIFGNLPQERNAIAELYSPPRVVEAAIARGLVADLSIDLSTGYDLSLPAEKERAREQIRKRKPRLLVTSPPCTKFSPLQNIKKYPELLQEELGPAIDHMDFSMEMQEEQLSRGDLGLHEHPDLATSWELPKVQQFLSHEEVLLIKSHLCRFGLIINGKLSRKSTLFATTCDAIAANLQRLCNCVDGHQQLINGLPHQAQTYPPALVKAIVDGLIQDWVDQQQGRPTRLPDHGDLRQWIDELFPEQHHHWRHFHGSAILTVRRPQHVPVCGPGHRTVRWTWVLNPIDGKWLQLEQARTGKPKKQEIKYEYMIVLYHYPEIFMTLAEGSSVSMSEKNMVLRAHVNLGHPEGRYGLVDKTHPSCVRPGLNTRVQH